MIFDDYMQFQPQGWSPTAGIEGEPGGGWTTSGNSAWQAAQMGQPQPNLPPSSPQPFPPFGGGSFFPGANINPKSDRSDLLNQTDAAFYGGGNIPPTPTPTPTPNGPSSWWKFWNRNQPTPNPSPQGSFNPPQGNLNSPQFGLGLNQFPFMNFGQNQQY